VVFSAARAATRASSSVTVRAIACGDVSHEPGFTVVQAGSLTEVRRLLEGVDIAILDLSLPDGNGADRIPELHAANPHAKAVVLTSSIDPGEGAQALQRGAAAVLNKLDHLDQLLATVKRLQRRPII
jgi:DNA-binding NarL/FixJ family response regulator